MIARILQLPASVSTIKKSRCGGHRPPPCRKMAWETVFSAALSLHLSFFPIRLPGYNNVSFAPQSSSEDATIRMACVREEGAQRPPRRTAGANPVGRGKLRVTFKGKTGAEDERD